MKIVTPLKVIKFNRQLEEGVPTKVAAEKIGISRNDAYAIRKLIWPKMANNLSVRNFWLDNELWTARVN